jgi:hypothetical protein
MTYIIGDPQKKGRYNKDLGKQKSLEFEKSKRLAERLRKTEPEEAARQIASVEDICKNFEKYLELQKGLSQVDGSVINLGYELAGELNPTAQDILDFSQAFDRYAENKEALQLMSIYFSALMKTSEDLVFALDFKRLNERGIEPGCIGVNAHDLEHLEIVGNLESYIGQDTTNTEFNIVGNVGNKLGFRARNCNFTIQGDAGEDVGYDAEGCVIKIYGNFEGLSNCIGKGSEVWASVIRRGCGNSIERVMTKVHPK